jgi:hypothetical protein
MDCGFWRVTTKASEVTNRDLKFAKSSTVLVADLGKPELDGFGFGARDGLDDAQQRGGFGALGFALLAVCRCQFELYDFLVRLHQTKQGLGSGDLGEVVFAVC